MTRRTGPPGLALLLLGALAGCSGDDGGDGGGDGAVGPGVGTVVEGQDWRLPYEDDDLNVCGEIAVWGPLGETPTVVRADGSVLELDPRSPTAARWSSRTTPTPGLVACSTTPASPS